MTRVACMQAQLSRPPRFLGGHCLLARWEDRAQPCPIEQRRDDGNPPAGETMPARPMRPGPRPPLATGEGPATRVPLSIRVVRSRPANRRWMWPESEDEAREMPHPAPTTRPCPVCRGEQVPDGKGACACGRWRPPEEGLPRRNFMSGTRRNRPPQERNPPASSPCPVTLRHSVSAQAQRCTQRQRAPEQGSARRRAGPPSSIPPGPRAGHP